MWAGSVASAASDQWNDNPDEWSQGSPGYGKRFASSFSKNALPQTFTFGLFEAFRLDTGFERSKRNGFMPRLTDALLQNVTSRIRIGKRIVAAPRFVRLYCAEMTAAETWYPSRYSYKDGLRWGTHSLASGLAVNFVR
ncbi:MAG: hypothetical protein ABR555_02345 [Pyrinomonadaceae bacterium]